MQHIIKSISAFLVFIVLFQVLSGSTLAATLTWTGAVIEGGQYKASNPANWSTGKAPQNGDVVVFDSTSNDCTWDLTLVSASFTINPGYTGTIILNTDLEIAKVNTWTGGGGNALASNPANWSTGQAPKNGDKLIFNDASSNNITWDLINVTPALFSVSSDYTGTITLNEDVTIGGNLTVAGGILDTNNKYLLVNGYVIIGSGGSVVAAGSHIEVKGDWLNAGNFQHGTSTVILSGTEQHIYGNTDFYNLTKIVTAADNLYFEAGSTQTVANSLVLKGTGSNLLTLRSTADGAYWYINPQGARYVSYTRIKDMNNTNFVNVVPLNSVDDGHNDDVSFGGSECVCLEEQLILAQGFCGEGRGVC